MDNGLFYDKKVDGYKLNQFRNDPRVDVEEKNHDAFTDITNDTLLVAKQFMVFAHLRCPKPPLNRYAHGLLQSTIRVQPTYYLGMNACNVLVGNEQAFYMPYTNEEWKSAKAYPMAKSTYLKDHHVDIKKSYDVNKKEYGFKGNFKDFQKLVFDKVYDGSPMVRKNPNEHWWDKAVNDVVNLCQERGVMANG